MPPDLTTRPPQGHVLKELEDEDLDMVVQLLLASGSLKELARRYQVSYPTIRLRLNRLIERVDALLDGRPLDPMAAHLAGLVERGEMSLEGAQSALTLHRESLERSHNS